MADNQESVVHGHGISGGMPLIHFHELLTVPEVDQRAKASDVTMALNYVHAQQAVLTSEIVVLRMAVATAAEHTALSREENKAHVAAIKEAAEAFSKRLEAAEKNFQVRMDVLGAFHQAFSETFDRVEASNARIEAAIAAIPQTYWWPRVKAWFRRSKT